MALREAANIAGIEYVRGRLAVWGNDRIEDPSRHDEGPFSSNGVPMHSRMPPGFKRMEIPAMFCGGRKFSDGLFLGGARFSNLAFGGFEVEFKIRDGLIFPGILADLVLLFFLRAQFRGGQHCRGKRGRRSRTDHFPARDQIFFLPFSFIASLRRTHRRTVGQPFIKRNCALRAGIIHSKYFVAEKGGGRRARIRGGTLVPAGGIEPTA